MKISIQKLLIFILVVAAMVCAAVHTCAFDDISSDDPYYDAVNALYSKKIVAGVSENRFDPNSNVTRWQMSLFISRALTGITDDVLWTEGAVIFEDCTRYLGAIQYCYIRGIIKGVTSDQYSPEAHITLRDGLIMAVRALGYEKEDANKYSAGGADYWKPYYITANEIGLLENMQTLDPVKLLTRAETAQLIFNMMNTKVYDSQHTLHEIVFEKINEETEENRTPAFIFETPKQNFGDDTLDDSDEYVMIAYRDQSGYSYIDISFEKLSDSFIDIYNIEEYFGAYIELVNCPELTSGNGYNYFDFEYLDSICTANRMLCDDAEIELFEEEDRIRIGSKTYFLNENSSRGRSIKLYTPDHDGEVYVPVDFYDDFAYKRYNAEFIDVDLDGYYEYGILLPVNIAEYSSPSSLRETCGVMRGVQYGDALYSHRPYVGELFAYSYNSLTGEINVNEVFEKKNGTVVKLSHKADEDLGENESNAVYITIDSEEYKLPKNKFSEIFGDVESRISIDLHANPEDLEVQATKLIGKSADYYVCGDTLVWLKEHVVKDEVNFLVFVDITDDNVENYISAKVYINGSEKMVNIGSVCIGDVTYDVSKITKRKAKELLLELGGLYTYEIDEASVYHITEHSNLYSLSSYITNDSSLIFNALTAEDYRSRAKTIRISGDTKIYVHNPVTGYVEKITPKPYGVFSISIDSDSMFYADKIGYGSEDNGHGVASILYITASSSEYYDYAKYKIVYVMDAVAADVIGYADELGFDAQDENDIYTKFDTSKAAYIISTLTEVPVMYARGGQSELGEGIYVIDSDGFIINHTAKDDLKTGEAWIDISDGNSLLYKVVKIDPEDIDLYGYNSILINGVDLLETNYIYKVKFNFKQIVEEDTVIGAKENRKLVDFLKMLRDENDIEEVTVVVVPNRYNNFEIVGTYPGNTFCGVVIDPIEITE